LSRERAVSSVSREFALSILSIMPSRNYVMQILRLLYESGGIDLDSFRQIYKGLIDENVESILYKLGVYVDKNTVKLKYMSIGWVIAQLHDELFNVFRDEGFRKKLSEASNIEIPDLLEEWIYIKLDILFRDPAHGDNAKIVLRELLRKTSVSVNELTVHGLNIGEAYTVADILQNLGLAQHIDGFIRLSPYLINRLDVLERVLKRLGVLR